MKEMLQSKGMIAFIVIVLGITLYGSMQDNVKEQTKSTYSTTDQSFRKGTNK